MGPAVPGDVVAGFDDLLDRFRELLDAARIDEESPRDLQAVQQPDQPPNADPTAIGRPRDQGLVDLWRSGRRLAAGPAVGPVSYTHLRAHETDSYLVCRL